VLGRSGHEHRRGLDGHLRAYAAASGRIICDVDTKGIYKTVDGTAALGGSTDRGQSSSAGCSTSIRDTRSPAERLATSFSPFRSAANRGFATVAGGLRHSHLSLLTSQGS
jgi:hypothetical protein